jgi:GT2 family glycosyltransferase
MNPIAIVIPTLDIKRGESIGKTALATAGCQAEVIVSHDPKRSGFTRTCNRGIKRADNGADICLLNDDILRFHHGWLATLQRALYSSPKFGLVGPSGGSNTAPMCAGKLGMSGLKPVKHIPFWCVLIKRKLIDKIGILDERFIHYASDSWYCDCTRKAGFQVVWVRDVFLKHKKHGSKLQSAWKKRDQALYRRRGKRGK